MVANEQENYRFNKTIENFRIFFHDYEILFVILCPNIDNSILKQEYMTSNFIQTLQKKRCNYNHPDQATSQANSLILLSSGIYTEEERFVFELLQNAVDAHNDVFGILNVRMMIEGGYFVFMHNGDAFTERDIEGLCDVGNGNKMQDVEKIGYKGIGFKSVFMRSSNVIVESGGYCFKFDKSYWENYWELHWNQKEFGNKDGYKKYLMPWQIIPIEAHPPIRIESKGYNVVTYVKINETTTLEKKITNLLSNSQFLLFLKSKNIRMDFIVNDRTICWINKSQNDDKVVLSANGVEESRWLLYVNDKVNVPYELKEAISSDINTPDKLKDVNTFDLSFAIALDKNGNLKKLTKEESIVYTYLPTSYRFGTEGFPFLVNANFITDAGRQQLHKDSEWNKLIFSKIPFEFLSWMKKLSTNYRNYYEILPEKSYGRTNALEVIYADEMQRAIDSIAFIPQQNDVSKKLLASETIIDKIGFSEAVNHEKLIDHINRAYHLNLSVNNFTHSVKNTRILSDYGVFLLNKDKVKILLEDDQVFDEKTVIFNVKLIYFLYDFCFKYPKDADELKAILSETKFLLDENMKLQSPNELFFYTDYKNENSLASNVNLLNQDVNNAIVEPEIIEWISKLGVKYLSNISFIEFLYNNENYITKENAIEIGKFVFHIYQTEDLFGKISQFKLGYVKFLTTRGSIKSASHLFLSSKYKPELDVELFLDEDIFISEKYCENASSAEWKVFLLKMGVKEDISNGNEVVDLYEKDYTSRFDKPFFDIIKENSQRYKWISYDGWNLDYGEYGFFSDTIDYGTFPFLIHCEKYNFSKLVFSKILSKYNPEEIDTNVNSVKGRTGLIPRLVDKGMLVRLSCNINHFKWVIENSPIVPTVKQKCLKASDVYSNSIPQIKEIAGNYLPVIDVEEEISESWQAYLGLKNYLTLEDYLFLLTEFAKDADNAANNRNRISCIYQKLVEFGCLDSEKLRTQIKEWSSQNKICSQNNIFMSPSDLNYITLDGFESKKRVYIGNPSNKEKVIELLDLMGVKIITSDSIKTEFEAKTESNELKNILKSRVPVLALLASGENVDETLYRSYKSKLNDLINQTHFYHCEKIKLTYGDSTDVMEKHSFGNKNEFYYIGNLRPANVEPLSEPLCRYLGIRGKEKEMFIMFFDTMDGIKQNLKDKGYQTEFIEDEQIVDSGNIAVTLDYHPSESAQERNMITGFKGEIIVYEKLISMGYHPECLSISTEDDYTHEVTMNGKTYFCKPNYEKYDISFMTNNGVQVFVEVKATTLNKQCQENLPISYRELTMIEDYNESDDKSYIIVRVFGIDKPEQDIYIFKGHLFNE